MLVYGLYEYRPAISWRVEIVTARKLQAPSVPSMGILATAVQNMAISMMRVLVDVVAHSATLILQAEVCGSKLRCIIWLWMSSSASRDYQDPCSLCIGIVLRLSVAMELFIGV